MTQARAQGQRMLQGWPTAVGILLAAGLIVLLWIGRADAATAADVLTAAALVYLGSAAVGHRAAAWPLFGLTFVLIGVSVALPAFPAFLAMVVLAVVLALYGIVRGRMRPVDGLPMQLLAMALVVVIVLIAQPAGSPWAGILAGAGLVAHAVWDLRHLRSRRVVAPSMAEFCAALDFVLAIGVIVVSLR